MRRDELDSLLNENACENDACMSIDPPMYISALIPDDGDFVELVLCLPCLNLALMTTKNYPWLKDDN
jgi:hypothetical protein